MNSYVSAVNQKKVYAELLLENAKQCAGQAHLQQALLQSAVFQLGQAYRFYLQEIASTYQCKAVENISDLWTLIANLQLLGKSPAETSEIYALSRQPDSWISQLHDCIGSFSRLPEKSSLAVADANRIPVFSTAQRYDWSLLEPDQVNMWIAQFSGMLERHRQAMVEW